MLITLQISFDITNEASLHIITLASAPQTTISIFVKSQLDFFVAGIASFSCFWCQIAIGPGITFKCCSVCVIFRDGSNKHTPLKSQASWVYSGKQ